MKSRGATLPGLMLMNRGDSSTVDNNRDVEERNREEKRSKRLQCESAVCPERKVKRGSKEEQR